MPGTPHVPHFSLLFSLFQSFGCSAPSTKQLRIAIKRNAVNLPEVEAIGLQRAQRLLEIIFGALAAALRRLGGEKICL